MTVVEHVHFSDSYTYVGLWVVVRVSPDFDAFILQPVIPELYVPNTKKITEYVKTESDLLIFTNIVFVK